MHKCIQIFTHIKTHRKSPVKIVCSFKNCKMQLGEVSFYFKEKPSIESKADIFKSPLA